MVRPLYLYSMKKLPLLLLLATTLFLACNNQPAANDSQPASSEAVTQAWDQMMVIHDEVMPEMSTMKKIEKRLKAMPQDSTTLQSITDLKKAEKAMWDWMHGLTPQKEVNKMSEAEALNYLKKSTDEISEVKRMMLESMEKGQKVLGEI